MGDRQNIQDLLDGKEGSEDELPFELRLWKTDQNKAPIAILVLRELLNAPASSPLKPAKTKRVSATARRAHPKILENDG
jgi:hypothetical protein